MNSDADICRNIESELHWDPSLDERGIGVTVNRGVVTLTGEVASHDDRWTAQEIAACVSGVRGVANEIQIKVLRLYTPRTGGKPRVRGQSEV